MNPEEERSELGKDLAFHQKKYDSLPCPLTVLNVVWAAECWGHSSRFQIHVQFGMQSPSLECSCDGWY